MRRVPKVFATTTVHTALLDDSLHPLLPRYRNGAVFLDYL